MHIMTCKKLFAPKNKLNIFFLNKECNLKIRFKISINPRY